MAVETRAPDAVLDSLNYTTLNLTDIDEDPASSDGAWGSWDGNGNTSCRVSFSTPTGAPTPGETQTFRVLLRKAADNAASSTWSLQLWENGSQVSELATGTTTALDPGEVVSGTWDAANLGTADGSLVECRLQQTGGGAGNPKAGIEVGAVAWDVVYSSSTTFQETLAAVAAHSATIAAVPTYVRTLSAAHSIATTVSTQATFARSLSATCAHSADVTTASTFFRTLAAAAGHSATIDAGLLVQQTLEAACAHSASISAATIFAVALGAAIVHAASIATSFIEGAGATIVGAMVRGFTKLVGVVTLDKERRIRKTRAN